MHRKLFAMIISNNAQFFLTTCILPYVSSFRFGPAPYMVMFYGTSWVGVTLFLGYGLRMAAAVMRPE